MEDARQLGGGGAGTTQLKNDLSVSVGDEVVLSVSVGDEVVLSVSVGDW